MRRVPVPKTVVWHPRNIATVVILYDQNIVLRNDTADVPGTGFTHRTAPWILSPWREDTGSCSCTKRGLNLFRNWAVIIDTYSHWDKTHHPNDAADIGITRILNRDFIARVQMCLQDTFHGVERTTDDGHGFG